ncbi:flagellar hook-associated protein 3 [Thermoanaerobacterium thermosaccharolyticum DSM 571]|uniref:Flagellar hook-associated protein 3 n=1 Tax=Thermoanaerobacterium thermosaccharolyticum (strain ATCC 7956 / DSM 571 / NCIMB 9385 / NCA 3814 / NCTC 13789 / WDCM 00135 / 2032) TaxID=580327 RepID=D9TRZ2_THETC|nr:flagellar hook-associated protein FlgL [Thermoanaerobacterium thermosaccharolyticum]ADL69671.1 flagellar hook-associated protein 3 [Thermoanaerobacterium thermosaccharolyticum DSM 571]
MRVTNNMLVMNFMSDYNSNLERLQKDQNMLFTGKKVSKPSDDPVAVANTLKIKTEIARNDAYTKNTDDAKSWLSLTDTALGQIGDLLQSARDLAVQGSNGTLTQSDMQNLAAQVDQLKQQIIQVGNTQYNGRYIFAGYKTNRKPFSDTNRYAGDDGAIQFEIGAGGNTIQVNVTGDKVFDVTSGTSQLLNVMDNLSNALKSGDNQTVSNIIGDIDNQLQNVLAIRADAGAKANRIDLTANRLSDDNYNFTALLSKNQDADIAQVITNLKMDENVYRASLASGAMIIQPSLVDFLR